MLGSNIYKTFRKESFFRIYGYTRKSKYKLPDVQMIYSDKNLANQVKKIHFNIIIHCAAEVNLNSCEEFKELAYESNVLLTMDLIKGLNFDDFIFISSDSVYKSNTREIKSEIDQTNPINHYSKTKLLSENYIKNKISKYYIIRTNIYGFSIPFKNSLFEWAFNQISSNEKIYGFENVIFNPLYVGQLSDILLKIITKKIPYGLYNIGSLKPISKYQFLKMIVNKFNFNTKLLKKTLYNIKSIPMRPINTTLDISKVRSLIDYDYSIEYGISSLFKDFKNQIKL